MTTQSTFEVPGMDCPSEERLIRLALEPLPEVQGLAFDLDGRTLVVFHACPVEEVLDRLSERACPRLSRPTDRRVSTSVPRDAC